MAILFPRVRPRDDVVEAFAERVARELSAGAMQIPPERVEEGVALIGEVERRRIVAELRDRYPDRWESLSAAAGDEALTERAVVASAVRGAVVERLPVRRGRLEMVEAMPVPASPCGVLALVLEAPLVWDRDDAIILAGVVGTAPDPQRFLTQAHGLADARVEDWHVGRVRELAERVLQQLPVQGLPRASAMLAEGVREVDEDEVAARWTAGLLLALYASLVASGEIERP